MRRSVQIAPSILAADFANLAGEISKVAACGAEVLHLDVMDGHFVPNITIGPPVVRAIRRATGLLLDAHLMISEPARYVEDIIRAGANWVSVHVEADWNINRTVNWIREKGASPGVAVNPATPLSAVEELLPIVDFVLLMTVNPGFGGQEFIEASHSRIHRLRGMITECGHPVRIEVDGGIGPANLDQVLASGADIIVSGSSIFGAPDGAASAFTEMVTIARRREKILESV